jgi:outer membrane protein assembly factor BamB
VTKDIYFGQGAIYALNEADGTQAWTYSFGTMASEGPAAYAGGNIYVETTDQAEKCVIWALDAALGTYQNKMSEGCQWSNFFAPTISGGSVLHTAQTGTVYSWAASSGALQWSSPGGAGDQATPGADSNHVYQYGVSSGAPALNIFDPRTGTVTASISDPFTTSFSFNSMFSSPVVGTSGDVISFSGVGFSGRAASSSEQGQSRVLVSYDVANKRVGWRSASAYMTHPALAQGVVYAGGNTPARLDAMSETDGHILWSWSPPAGDSAFHRNMVVTDNLIFVSTDVHVYALDLTTHQVVWQYPSPGMLAISASGVLYIVTGATISDGNLVAVKLK